MRQPFLLRARAGTFGFQKEMGALDSLRASSDPGEAGGSDGAAQNVRALLSSTKEIELRVVRSSERLHVLNLFPLHQLHSGGPLNS